VTGGRATNVHRLFEVALWLKAADSFAEVLGALVLAFVPVEQILHLARLVTDHELSEDPNDFVANLVLRTAEQLNFGAKSAAALFLFSHGIIKLALVAGVLAGFMWAYPAFIAALSLLILYQGYQLSYVMSAGLLALTILDVVVLALTINDYRLKRAERPRPSGVTPPRKRRSISH
jgi:uncharacterized membrane protein